MPRFIDTNVEPKFDIEITQSQLIAALNWYSQNKVRKDAEKYAQDYLKKKHKIDVSDPLKDDIATFGFVCRIVSNGATLPEKNQIWFENKIEQFKKQKKEKVVVATVEEKTGPTIQERIADKIAEIAGDLEGSIDDYILSGFDKMPSPYGIMHDKTKAMHANRLVEIFKRRRNQFDEVLTSNDPQIKEGYSCFTKTQLKKIVAYCDQIILDCMKIAGESAMNRKPRKRKVKTPEQLVAKLIYQTEFAELKLKSIAPTFIVGAMQLWVYNTKTRKLGVYHAEDAGGLSVKGSSLVNFAESKSIQKKLRKPEVTLPEVLTGGKVAMRNLLDGIRAVASELNGRINKDTILVRVIK